MAIDPLKLKKYVEMYGARPSMAVEVMPVSLGNIDDDEREEISEELADEMSETAQLARKLNPYVGYMEVAQPAGAFACGTCKWAVDGMCMHAEVRAEVNSEHGCCNFWGAGRDSGVEVVFPPTENDHEISEDESDDDEDYDEDDEFEDEDVDEDEADGDGGDDGE